MNWDVGREAQIAALEYANGIVQAAIFRRYVGGLEPCDGARGVGGWIVIEEGMVR